LRDADARVLTRIRVGYPASMGKAEEIWDEIRRDGAGAVRRILAAGTSEDTWVEFKRAVPPKDILSKNASAFANTEGER
jgi:hypothetical protein